MHDLESEFIVQDRFGTHEQYVLTYDQLVQYTKDVRIKERERLVEMLQKANGIGG